MTTTIITCDRCGREIVSGRSLLRVESGPLRDRRSKLDLCPACVELLLAWLGSGVVGGDGPVS